MPSETNVGYTISPKLSELVIIKRIHHTYFIRELVAALETEFLYRNREITWIFDAKKLDLSAGGRSVNLVVQEVIKSLYKEPVLLLFLSNSGRGGGHLPPLQSCFRPLCIFFILFECQTEGEKFEI